MQDCKIAGELVLRVGLVNFLLGRFNKGFAAASSAFKEYRSQLFMTDKKYRIQLDYQMEEVRGTGQCDQIGHFLNVLGSQFSYKIDPIFSRVWLWGYFGKYHFVSGNCLGSFYISLGYSLIQHLVTLADTSINRIEEPPFY